LKTDGTAPRLGLFIEAHRQRDADAWATAVKQIRRQIRPHLGTHRATDADVREQIRQLRQTITQVAEVNGEIGFQFVGCRGVLKVEPKRTQPHAQISRQRKTQARREFSVFVRLNEESPRQARPEADVEGERGREIDRRITLHGEAEAVDAEVEVS